MPYTTYYMPMYDGPYFAIRIEDDVAVAPVTYASPYKVIAPVYADMDLHVTNTPKGNIYINNTAAPVITLQHGTIFFIQSAANSYPINLSLVADTNNNSLSSFLTYFIQGNQVNNYSEYKTKFLPSALTYIKFKCTYQIPATAVYYFNPERPGKGNKINVLATENVSTFVLTSATRFLMVSADEYEFFLGSYKDDELLLNVRSEYTGTTAQLPCVTSYRLPVSSYAIIDSLNGQNQFIINYHLNYLTLSGKVVTITKL